MIAWLPNVKAEIGIARFNIGSIPIYQDSVVLAEAVDLHAVLVIAVPS
jgi:hypothetical protein